MLKELITLKNELEKDIDLEEELRHVERLLILYQDAQNQIKQLKSKKEENK